MLLKQLSEHLSYFFNLHAVPLSRKGKLAKLSQQHVCSKAFVYKLILKSYVFFEKYNQGSQNVRVEYLEYLENQLEYLRYLDDQLEY